MTPVTPKCSSPMSKGASRSPDPLQLPTAQKNTTASQILASFSPKVYTKTQPHLISPPSSFPITMESRRRTSRAKQPVQYSISSDSDNGSASGVDSSFSSPTKTPRKPASYVDLDDELEEIEPPGTPQPRISSAGHSLRQHNDMHLSLRAQENADKPRVGKRNASKRSIEPSKTSRAKRQSSNLALPKTARNEIRAQIAHETADKRAKFFVSKKEHFLPLLPENNFVQRLVDQHGVQDLTVPYEVLEKQPIGVKAEMKPYQLLGLSFLVWLHRNGVSGILGDEMGLGKTLQTLSLLQYLKENKTSKKSSELRPALVVCPLSVLNSWMAEAKKWTPGLKVLRFHGPVNERNRLKLIATGEIDHYGNKTREARRRKNSRLTAAGKSIIDLDPESGEENAEELGVDLIVTTYEGYLAEQTWLKRAFVWSYVILDEGHKIKNELSLVSKALQGLGAEYRLILTGTPLQNNMLELWALLHWLYPEVFTEKTSGLFKESFNLTKGKVSTKVMDDARSLLEVIMLRRMKNSEGVDLNLPPKTDVLLYVPLTPMQRFWYMRLITRADQGLLEELFQGARKKEEMTLESEAYGDDIRGSKDLEALEGSGGRPDAKAEWEESKAIMKQALENEEKDEQKKSAWKKLMNLLMQLRKCCNHPYCLPHAEPEPYYIGEHVIRASAKFIVLDKIISELVIKQKKKVLIFSGFTRMLDCCEDFLALRENDGETFKHVRLDGSTARARRNLGIRMFNQKDSNYRVMLISTRAGGLGINLATASDVILLDQDWNPQIMLQAEARAHRIGQTKPVTVYKLCTQGTVEEQMMGRIQKKLFLSLKVTESMRGIHSSAQKKKTGPGGRVVANDDDMPQLDTNQLLSLVRRGAQTLAHPELDVNEMLDWDWATTLEKCKDKPADISVSDPTRAGATREESERHWLSQIEHVESRVFQGKKHYKAKEVSAIGEEWSKEQRREGKNTTVMIDGYAVSKESIGCDDWEAVPTMAGKDPRLADPKREKKAAVVNQEHCQICWDGGNMTLCSGCPRSYHYTCLDTDTKLRSKGKMHFSCPQHQCFDCEQKTSDAGGMLYRCRWCERGYCEDCLDWDKTDLLGENLKEYEILGFPAVSQAHYIKCPNCTDHHLEDRTARAFCERAAAEIDEKYTVMVDEQALIAAAAEVANKTELAPSRAGSMTDATTFESSGISTPQVFLDNQPHSSSTGRKRKAEDAGEDATPTKRSHKTMS